MQHNNFLPRFILLFFLSDRWENERVCLNQFLIMVKRLWIFIKAHLWKAPAGFFDGCFATLFIYLHMFVRTDLFPPRCRWRRSVWILPSRDPGVDGHLPLHEVLLLRLLSFHPPLYLFNCSSRCVAPRGPDRVPPIYQFDCFECLLPEIWIPYTSPQSHTVNISMEWPILWDFWIFLLLCSSELTT